MCIVQSTRAGRVVIENRVAPRERTQRATLRQRLREGDHVLLEGMAGHMKWLEEAFEDVVPEDERNFSLKCFWLCQSLELVRRGTGEFTSYMEFELGLLVAGQVFGWREGRACRPRSRFQARVRAETAQT